MTYQRSAGRSSRSRARFLTTVGPTLDKIRAGQDSLNIGHRGEAVAYIQQLLGIEMTGVYAISTIQALSAFQTRKRLSSTGQVDQETLRSLEQSMASMLAQARGGSSAEVRTIEDIDLTERHQLQIVTGPLTRFAHLEQTAERPSQLPKNILLYFSDPAFPKMLKAVLETIAVKMVKILSLHSSVTLCLNFALDGLKRVDPSRTERGTYLYRFTYFEQTPGKQALLVEELGPFNMEQENARQLQEGSKKFETYQFKFSKTEWAPGWSKPEERVRAEQSVYRAVSLLPENILTQIQGLTITSSTETGKGAAAYSIFTHTLTIFGLALLPGEFLYGTPLEGVHDNMTRELVHELGHALDTICIKENYFNSLSDSESLTTKANKVYSDYQKTTEALKKAQNNAKSQKEQNHFALKRAEATNQYNSWKVQHETNEARRTAGVATVRRTTLSESGYLQYEKRLELYKAETTTPFLDAVKQDGGVFISEYGGDTTRELFAECYSFYITDRTRLNALRPAIFKYLDERFGRRNLHSE